MSLVITTNGNAIDITDNGSATVSLVNEAYNWYFHNNVLRLTAGPMDLFAAVGSVEINGNTPGNEADLNTALGAVFPQSGSGSTPGIDDVLAEGQALTNNRIIDLGGNTLLVNNGVVQMPFSLAVYADNAAAIADGVPNNFFYVTIESGERIVKQAYD